MKMRDTTLLPPDVKLGPGVDMVSMMPVDKWDDPGVGLRDVPHRVLRYGQLVARMPGPDTRPPSRLFELHLTGNMERYMWSFDGEAFSAVSDKPSAPFRRSTWLLLHRAGERPDCRSVNRHDGDAGHGRPSADGDQGALPVRRPRLPRATPPNKKLTTPV